MQGDGLGQGVRCAQAQDLERTIFAAADSLEVMRQQAADEGSAAAVQFETGGDQRQGIAARAGGGQDGQFGQTETREPGRSPLRPGG